jgi:hypothetical protein
MPGTKRGVSANRCGRSLGLGAAAMNDSSLGARPKAPIRKNHLASSGLATTALRLSSSGPIIIVIVGPLPSRIGRDRGPHRWSRLWSVGNDAKADEHDEKPTQKKIVVIGVVVPLAGAI